MPTQSVLAYIFVVAAWPQVRKFMTFMKRQKRTVVPGCKLLASHNVAGDDVLDG